MSANVCFGWKTDTAIGLHWRMQHAPGHILEILTSGRAGVAWQSPACGRSTRADEHTQRWWPWPLCATQLMRGLNCAYMPRGFLR